MSAPKRFLITGGGGALGYALCKALALKAEREQQPFHVTIIDPLRHDFPRPQALSSWMTLDLKQVELGVWLSGGRTWQDRQHTLAAGLDAIAHLATPSYNGQGTTHVVDVADTAKLIQWAMALTIPRFLFTSSAAVYGEMKGLRDLDASPPRSWYGVGKLLSEQVLQHALREQSARLPDLDTFPDTPRTRVLIVRPFNLVGPGLRASSFLTSLLMALYTGDAFSLHDGRRVREWVSLSMTAMALAEWLWMTPTHPPGLFPFHPYGGTVSAYHHHALPLLDFAWEVARVLGKSLRLEVDATGYRGPGTYNEVEVSQALPAMMPTLFHYNEGVHARTLAGDSMSATDLLHGDIRDAWDALVDVHVEAPNIRIPQWQLWEPLETPKE